ncbi:MAG TPA: flagellar motor protein MotB [Lachnospiraceae bacterium]|nr:flagellar motor protein MotB [Lachnospiraceae bacterium]
MAAKRKPEEVKTGAAWMNTFSDLMNLLLCFFVLLFSMSTVDAQKFELIAASFAQNFSIFSAGSTAIGEGVLVSNGVSQLNELDQYINTMGYASEKTEATDEFEQVEEEQMKESEQLAERVEESVAEENLDKEIDIDFTSQYVSLTLNGALLFDSGSDTIKEEAYPVLDKVGVILQKYGNSLIEIEGHTDNVPIHNAQFANNNELSSARALSVFDYLLETTNLDPALLKHTGRGEYVPVADNTTNEGRQKNRRVEIKIFHTLSTY